MTDQMIPADKVRDIIARHRDGASHRGGMILDDLKDLLPAPEPQIIRTLADLESLDPDTIMLDSVEPYTADHAVAAIYDEAYEDQVFLPAVVIATGEHVRAARQALKENQ